MSLLPPPDATYATRQELLTAVKGWASSKGYALVIARSDQHRLTLKCDRGGTYRDKRNLTDDVRRRVTGSRLIGCPFMATGSEIMGQWWFSVRVPDHNHEASVSAVQHPSLRRLDQEQRHQIEVLSKVGANPRTILAAVREELPMGQAIIARDVYNARTYLRAEALAGQTPIQALVNELDQTEFFTRMKVDAGGHITHLFFARRQSLATYEEYPEVVLLDCTYKTNRFKMPLLNIIGITGLNTSYYIAFAFIKSEKEEDFTWVLEQLASSAPVEPRVFVTDRDLALMNAIGVVFPESQGLLCQWHIQQNVNAKCKKHFAVGTGENDPWTVFQNRWTGVVQSRTASQFEEEWQKMKNDYQTQIIAVNYIQNIWIPWKEKFVAAWTHRSMHCGTVVTSRVESAHSALKRYLEVSTGDLHKVYTHIVRLLDHQQIEHEAAAAQQLSRIPHKLNKPIFGHLIGKITTYGLYKLENELARSRRSDFPPVCDGLFTSSMGLPCGHILKQRAETGQPVHLREIDRHWYFNPLEASTLAHERIILEPQLQNPLPARTRGRPPGASPNNPSGTRGTVSPGRGRGRGRGVTSTRRKPSGFEITGRLTRSGVRRGGTEGRI